ncbi:MAG: porin family protein [Paludibacter sp.]
MKKLIFIAVLLLSFTAANAQLNFGVKAGYNSSLTFENVGSVTNGGYDLNSVTSEMWNNFHAGLFARVFFGKMIYVQPELLYSIQKKEYKIGIADILNPSISNVVKNSATVSTVDVPLLVGVKLIDLKIVNLRVFAGPKLRFNAGSSLAFENVTSGSTFDTKSLVSDIKKAQVGLEVGAGVDVLMFALDARYNLIGDMYTTKVQDLSLQNLPSNTFVISLGWKLF